MSGTPPVDHGVRGREVLGECELAARAAVRPVRGPMDVRRADAANLGADPAFSSERAQICRRGAPVPRRSSDRAWLQYRRACRGDPPTAGGCGAADGTLSQLREPMVTGRHGCVLRQSRRRAPRQRRHGRHVADPLRANRGVGRTLCCRAPGRKHRQLWPIGRPPLPSARRPRRGRDACHRFSMWRVRSRPRRVAGRAPGHHLGLRVARFATYGLPNGRRVTASPGAGGRAGHAQWPPLIRAALPRAVGSRRQPRGSVARCTERRSPRRLNPSALAIVAIWARWRSIDFGEFLRAAARSASARSR